MTRCELSYAALPVSGNASEVVKVVEMEVPAYRTLVVDSLHCETEYWMRFTCWDLEDDSHHSELVPVTTDNCTTWRDTLPSTSSDFNFRFIRSSHIKSSVSPHAVLGTDIN